MSDYKDQLHASIMNLPLAGTGWVPDCMTPNERMGYVAGHRDARHAAAELVAATTPKQEAVTAAVVASGETMLDTSRAAFELWATFNAGDALPTEGAMWGSDWLYDDSSTRAAYAMWRYLHRAYKHHPVIATIPRVADHLEDGGKAEAALRELVEARDALSKANAALNARFRTEQFVRVTMPSPEAERMDAAWSVARRIVVEANPQRTAIGMRREGGDG